MDAGEVIGTVAAVVVGGVLVWAGFAKLRAGALWVRQADAMGVGHRLAAPVPWAEIVVGVTLATRIASPWPAVAAGVLLVVFTGLLLLRLADGSRTPCPCFGARSNRPLGAVDVFRNVLLLALVLVTLIGAS